MDVTSGSGAGADPGRPSAGAGPDATGPAGLDHDRPQRPGRARVVWVRAWVVLVLAFVLASTPWGLLRDGDGGVRSHVLGAAALVCVLPLVVSVWGRAARPYPHDRTMLVLSRGLTTVQRRSVDRALRGGRADGIPHAHHAYAGARAARLGRELIFAPSAAGVLWGQTLSAASREPGSGFFWFVLVGAVTATALAYVALVLQRRRERTVARLAPDRRPRTG